MQGFVRGNQKILLIKFVRKVNPLITSVALQDTVAVSELHAFEQQRAYFRTLQKTNMRLQK